jgi:hypothetical protein
MGVIDDLPLRRLVTGLFLFSAAGFVLVADWRSWTSMVSHGLHVTMSIAMAAMAWMYATMGGHLRAEHPRCRT